MRQRSTFWDNYKGILIFLVVFGHFIYTYAAKKPDSLAHQLYIFIYSFHMPAFIFCSGYFSRSERSRGRESLTQLLVYYLVFNTTMLVFMNVYRGTDFKFLGPYYSYWYILSLIAWRAAIGHLDKVKLLVPMSVLITLLMGFSKDFTLDLSIRRTIAFFPFFAAGYLVNREKLERFLANRSPRKMLLCLIPVVIVGILSFWAVQYFGITDDATMMASYTKSNTILHRVLLLAVSAAAIIGMLLVVPNRRIPLLSRIGKNSLLIYLAHRFITILYYFELFPADTYSRRYLVYAVIATVITCVIFGNEILNKTAAALCKKAAAAMSDRGSKAGAWLKTLIVLGFLVLLAINAGPGLQKTVDRLLPDTSSAEVVTEPATEAPTDPVTEAPTDPEVETEPDDGKHLSAQLEAELSNAIKLSYVGDLLLLKDQVTSAYNETTGSYDFSGVFEYAAPYLQEADLAIGVYEGPSAGGEKGYTTSNFGDGITIYLNFPDEFAQAVKDAGIDLVTTANNHLLDMDLEGAMRTLDVLDAVGLLHTGSYRNQQEKDKLMIVEVEGVKIAVLSYLTNINYYPIEEVSTNTPWLTSIMPQSKHNHYDALLAQAEADFARARESGADLIMVMAHMGTQFSHETSNFQNRWNSFFAEQGADIILGDHAHAVQPIEYIGNTLVINCPGNFANSYIAKDGDATAIAEIYISRDTKEVIGSSVIPMYTQELKDNYFRALPIYSIVNNEALYNEMSTSDIARISEVHELVTEVMVGQSVGLSDIQPRYYFIDGKYRQERRVMFKSAHDYADSILYQLIDGAGSVTFIGDSITEGTKNDWHPWYEPMMADFKGKVVKNVSKGGYTVKKLMDEFSQDILDSHTDLYVVAIGCNDVRYRNKKTCAMTPDAYVDALDEMADLIHQSNSEAKIVFLPPWMTLDNDQVSSLGHEEKNALTDAYGQALAAYAAEQGDTYINPNEYLRSFFANAGRNLYTDDGIHPNNGRGLELYSMAVLESCR